MSQPSQFELALKAVAALWWALFWLLVTFGVGVIVWAVAGPKVFALAMVVVIALPLYLWGRGARR